MEPTQTQPTNEANLTKKERRMLRREERRNEVEKRSQKKTFKRAGMWALLFILLGGAVYGMASVVTNSPGPVAGGEASLITAVNGLDRVKGIATSSVVLIEYSDFQCPACGLYFPMVKQLMQEYGDRITFAYRNFPLPQHKNAKLAAYTAESAGTQDKFWEMHDILFENQEEWSELGNARAKFINYAETIGLDITRFETDIDSSIVKEKIDIDTQSALTAGVNSTPTFFLNGVKIQNPRSYDEFRTYIENALAENS